MHPEERRNIDFARVDRRQKPKTCQELNDVIKAQNVRYFIDLKVKLLNFEKVKKMLGDLSKINDQQEHKDLIYFVEDNFAYRLPWEQQRSEHHEITRGFYDEICNVSDHRNKFEIAKYIFKSDAYIILPRYLRYALARYIAMIMIEIRKPYEPI